MDLVEFPCWYGLKFAGVFLNAKMHVYSENGLVDDWALFWQFLGGWFSELLTELYHSDWSNLGVTLIVAAATADAILSVVVPHCKE